MKRIRIYLCAFLFVALTAVKLVAPASAAEVRSAVQEQITRDDDYRAAGRNRLSGKRERESDASRLRRAIRPSLPLEEMEQDRESHAAEPFFGAAGGAAAPHAER